LLYDKHFLNNEIIPTKASILDRGGGQLVLSQLGTSE